MISRKPAHLLLVDDDPGLLKLLGMRLTSEGYSVVTAESGAEALRILARDKVELVVSDLRMDEMDGLQLFSEIQKVHPGMPVIILTAHGSIPDAVAATQQGVFADLPRQFTVNRYHSLVIDQSTLPECLEITATSEDGEIQGVRHRELAIEGVQFHPESILTEHGHAMLRNFLEQRA